MNDLEIRLVEQDILASFPRNEVGRALAEQALAAWRAATDDDGRGQAENAASMAGNYAAHVFRTNAWFRDGDMEEWRTLPKLGIEEIFLRWKALRQAWEDRLASVSDEEQWAADDEAARIDRLEAEGAYGRTLPYDPESERWIYIRFGGMPAVGKSVFGLAREDTEDGPDPWRQELGDMTHEAGVSVFRAYMHPDVEGAYVLVAPAFELARYGVPGQEAHLLSVFPRGKPGDTGTAIRVDGSLATCRAPDRTLRLELGSDGEYLIDPKKPCTVHPVDVASIWVSEKESLPDFLSRTRFYEMWSDDEPSGSEGFNP